VPGVGIGHGFNLGQRGCYHYIASGHKRIGYSRAHMCGGYIVTIGHSKEYLNHLQISVPTEARHQSGFPHFWHRKNAIKNKYSHQNA
jgi:hypothetical protein